MADRRALITGITEMIRGMVDADLELLGRGVPQQQAG